MNAQRVRRIRRNYDLFIKHSLHKVQPRLRRHRHGLYLLFARNGEPKSDIRALVTKLRGMSGSPLFYADSFGLDVSMVTIFQGDKKHQRILRVALPDMSAEDFLTQVELYDRIIGQFSL